MSDLRPDLLEDDLQELEQRQAHRMVVRRLVQYVVALGANLWLGIMAFYVADRVAAIGILQAALVGLGSAALIAMFGLLLWGLVALLSA